LGQDTQKVKKTNKSEKSEKKEKKGVDKMGRDRGQTEIDT